MSFLSLLWESSVVVLLSELGDATFLSTAISSSTCRSNSERLIVCTASLAAAIILTLFTQFTSALLIFISQPILSLLSISKDDMPTTISLMLRSAAVITSLGVAGWFIKDFYYENDRNIQEEEEEQEEEVEEEEEEEKKAKANASPSESFFSFCFSSFLLLKDFSKTFSLPAAFLSYQNLFLKTFLLSCLTEMGDRSQLSLFSLTSAAYANNNSNKNNGNEKQSIFDPSSTEWNITPDSSSFFSFLTGSFLLPFDVMGVTLGSIIGHGIAILLALFIGYGIAQFINRKSEQQQQQQLQLQQPFHLTEISMSLGGNNKKSSSDANLSSYEIYWSKTMQIGGAVVCFLLALGQLY